MRGSRKFSQWGGGGGGGGGSKFPEGENFNMAKTNNLAIPVGGGGEGGGPRVPIAF